MKIPEGWPTDEMTQAGFAALPEGFNKIGYDVLRSVFKAMIEAAPTPPAQDDEPVAWVEVKDSHNGPYEFHGQELLPPGKHNLYTRPDNSGLRKAAGELLKQLDWACDIKFSGHENSKAYYKAARELRVALEGK